MTGYVRRRERRNRCTFIDVNVNGRARGVKSDD